MVCLWIQFAEFRLLTINRTPYWMTKLNHKFGDDVVFWIRFEDMLKEFPRVHRTRLFGSEWNITQSWTRVQVAWVTGYQKSKFVVKVPEAGPVVIVLSQVGLIDITSIPWLIKSAA